MPHNVRGSWPPRLRWRQICALGVHGVMQSGSNRDSTWGGLGTGALPGREILAWYSDGRRDTGGDPPFLFAFCRPPQEVTVMCYLPKIQSIGPGPAHVTATFVDFRAFATPPQLSKKLSQKSEPGQCGVVLANLVEGFHQL